MDHYILSILDVAYVAHVIQRPGLLGQLGHAGRGCRSPGLLAPGPAGPCHVFLGGSFSLDLD